MKEIYIVKRPLKSNGVFHPVGSLIEDPTNVKLLKTKINEGKIVVLSKEMKNLGEVIAYLEVKCALDLRDKIMAALEEEVVEEKVIEAVPPVKEAPPEVKTTPEPVKVVAPVAPAAPVVKKVIPTTNKTTK